MTSDICKVKELLQKDTPLSGDEIDAFSRAIAHLTEQFPVNSYEVGNAIERIINKLNNINKI